MRSLFHDMNLPRNMGIILFGILLLSCSYCSKENWDTETVDTCSEETILTWKNEGVSVDSIQISDDVFRMVFSNDEVLLLKKEDVPIYTIDERGYWKKNGELTNSFLSDAFPPDIKENNISSGDLLSIVESYTGWYFIFSDGTNASIDKTLYSFDPDITVRGINHRGYNRFAPENTLPAYRLSRLMGFKYVEADIYFTSDGVPVLLHDATINRTSDGEGNIKELTWEQVRAFDFGAWKNPLYAGTKIPSLEEFLELCKQIGLVPYIELKTGSREQIVQIVELVKEYGLEDEVIYISATSTYLRYVSDYKQNATLGYLTNSPLSENHVQTALSLKNSVNIVFIDTPDTSENAVALCSKVGLPMEVWVINSELKIRSQSKYISGVTSDVIHAGRVLRTNK